MSSSTTNQVPFDSTDGRNPLSYLNQNQGATVLRVVADRVPTTNDRRFKLGTVWIDTTTNQVYCLASVVNNLATWSILGPGASDVDTLTGDTGGAISPAAGNINIVGGDLVTVNGSGSTLTIDTNSNGYPITQYVVGAAGEAGYTTIQAALNAADAAGGGAVYIQPGTYTEDLTLYTGVSLSAAEGNVDSDHVSIIGTHTPPTDNGVLSFRHLNFFSTGPIIFSAAAGQAYMVFETCNLSRSTSGYVLDLDNWVGPTGLFTGPAGIALTNSGDLSTSDSGLIKNSVGGMTIALINSYVGSLGGGGSVPMLLSGELQLSISDVYCPIQISGGTGTFIEQCGFHGVGITASGATTGTIANCNFTGLSDPFFTMSSSGDWDIGSCLVDTSNDPAVDGAGAGTLNLSGVEFLDNANVAATITLGSSDVMRASGFRTNALATGVTYSANNIDATGSDTNITITVTPKGTGDFVVDLGDIQNTSGDIIATHSSSGADVTLEATNSDNTNNASRAGVELAVGGTSAGDPYANFLISGGQSFTMGIDNSTANDDFVISDSSALGTNNRVSVDGSTGIVTVASGLTSGGTTSINDNVNANTTINTGTSTGTVTVGSANAGAIAVDTGSGISLDGATASNFTVTGASADLTLSSVGGSVNISASEAAADAIVIDASDAAGGIQLTAGSNGVTVDGNLSLITAATQLQVEGGAATDFIGQTTLALGTATVANTNIAATDKVFVSREGVGLSSALGVLDVAITASTNFIITALQPGTPGMAETGDLSVVNYFIVRQL